MNVQVPHWNNLGTLFVVAAKETAMSDSEKNGAPGTTDQRPRWEGPPENRPAGYKPAKDDPTKNRYEAGENLKDPDRSRLRDAFKTRKNV